MAEDRERHDAQVVRVELHQLERAVRPLELAVLEERLDHDARAVERRMSDQLHGQPLGHGIHHRLGDGRLLGNLHVEVGDQALSPEHLEGHRDAGVGLDRPRLEEGAAVELRVRARVGIRRQGQHLHAEEHAPGGGALELAEEALDHGQHAGAVPDEEPASLARDLVPVLFPGLIGHGPAHGLDQGVLAQEVRRHDRLVGPGEAEPRPRRPDPRRVSRRPGRRDDGHVEGAELGRLLGLLGGERRGGDDAEQQSDLDGTHDPPPVV